MVAAALAASLPAPARAGEPLCDWLLSLAKAAQAQAERDLPAAEANASRALRARPRGPAAARASASLGLALLARGEPARAAESLEVALATPIPARAHLAFSRGEALLASGDAPRAARLFEEAKTGGSDLALSRIAALREADALLAAGLAAEAVPQLEELLRLPLDPSLAPPARLSLARGLRALGHEELAVGLLRVLWLELPDHPEGRSAGEMLAQWRAGGGDVPPESGADHAARAERLLIAAHPEDALLELDAAARAGEPPADPERAALLRALALLALGRHPDAERQAMPLAEARDPGVRRGAQLVLARSAARAGRVEEASRLFASVAAIRAPIPGLPDARQRDIGDESSFVAAWLFYDAGQFEQAIRLLEAFARANPRSRRADDALWFAAWSRFRLGRMRDADRALARLSRGAFRDAALYWRARLADGADAQRSLYRATALASGGEGWYGLLARIRLAALGEAARRPRADPAGPLAEEVPDPWAAGRLSVAVELLALGLRKEALAELRELSRTPRARASAPLVAQLAAFAGDCELPFRLARDQLGMTRRTLRWLYPEPWPDLLRPASHELGVDPALVLAVMRRESSFRADARSAAGAEGLLQLRPATAERLAALLGLPAGLGARLHDPDTAIPVGIHYLGLLLARFEDPALAVAAYNAGPAPVADWAAARSGMALDAWVESIPYRETRQYVKVVLAAWDAYRALNGENAPPIDPDRRIGAAPPGIGF